MSTLITVEGNIAAGKTTFLQELRHTVQLGNKDIYIDDEPINLFQQLPGTTLNPLQEFYADPSKNTFAFQNHVLDCYALRFEHLEKMNQPIVVLDRGLEACSIFTKANEESLTRFENAYLEQKFKTIKNRFFPEKDMCTDGVYFLQVSPAQSNLRLAMRNRPEEQKVTVDYLTKVDKCYNQYLSDLRMNNIMVKETSKPEVNEFMTFLHTVCDTKICTA